MRNFTLLLITLFVITNSQAQNPATVFTNLNRNITLGCGSACTSVTVTVPDIKQTDNYIVTTMPYLPFPYVTTGGISVGSLISASGKDDQFTQKIPLPFTFCFYGITYPSLLIGTNANITFDTSLANGGSGYTISSPIPSTSYKKASIFGPYHDIDIDYATASTNSTIEYRIEGTAPNRRLVASYSNVPYFSCQTAMFATHQMVLYEGTGVIEVYIQDKPVCSGWNGGLTILGVQDETQTRAVAAPGKNATVWGTVGMNEAYRFTPSGGASRFKSAQIISNGNVLATGTSAPGNTGELNLSFPNFCLQPNDSILQVKVTYGFCNDPSKDVYFLDTVKVKRTAPTLALSATNAACNTGGTITANVTCGNGTVQYAIDAGTFQNTNTFSNVAAGPHVVTIKDNAGFSINQTINVGITNNLNVQILTPDTTVCRGVQFIPRVTSNGTQFAWSPGTAIVNPTVMGATLSPYQPSTLFTLTATLGSCSKTASFRVNTFQGFTVDAGQDQTMIVGDVVQLNGSSSVNGTYLWTPPTGLSATNILSPSARPTTTTTYTLTATSPAGCVESDTVRVTVLPNCIQPMNSFTPNGDGINDVWLVTNAGCAQYIYAQVFNRYGAKVFEASDYHNNWNGTYEGKPLPDGTYYYVLTYKLPNNKIVNQKGNVTILR